MNKYFLFAYDDDFPGNGTGDCQGIFDYFEQAKLAAKRLAYDNITVSIVTENRWVELARYDWGREVWVDNHAQAERDAQNATRAENSAILNENAENSA